MDFCVGRSRDVGGPAASYLERCSSSSSRLWDPSTCAFPLYNAVSVKDAVAASRPDALALTPLEPGALDTPDWQDTPEVALPLAVVPWAKKRGLPLHPVLEPSPDRDAERDFRRYAAQYTEARNLLSEVDARAAASSAALGGVSKPETHSKRGAAAPA